MCIRLASTDPRLHLQALLKTGENSTLANLFPSMTNAGTQPHALPLLIELLLENGMRVFSTDTLRQTLRENDLPADKLAQQLHRLTQRGWLRRLKRGLYALTDPLLSEPLRELEIGAALVFPSALSHWTAWHYHGLTEQIPRDVFLLTTTEVELPRQRDRARHEFELDGIRYRFTRVAPDQFFGIARPWVDQVRLSITDLERTVLDGFLKPELCGGLDEVLGSLEDQLHRLKLERLVVYALRIGPPAAQRVGWALEHLGAPSKALEPLLGLPHRGFRPLDPSRPRRGPCNRRWGIQENLSA